MWPRNWFRSLSRTALSQIQRGLVSVTVGLILATVTVAFPKANLNHLGEDALIASRHWLEGPRYAPEEADTVVVALDEATYRRPPFEGTPKVAWTPYLAKVIDAIGQAQPRVMGLDIIFPTTLDQPELLPGYDSAWRQSLYRHGRKGRLILARTRLSNQSIEPTRGQVHAVGGPENVRRVNLPTDIDNVVRRYPIYESTQNGSKAPLFGAELARRAGATLPDSEFLIDFNTASPPVPTYRLDDLHDCARRGADAFFQRQFTDKIVLIGQTLDVEDRFLTANRWTAFNPGASEQPGCADSAHEVPGASQIERATVPGVFIHAQGVENLLHGDRIRVAPVWWQYLIVFITCAGSVFVCFQLRPFKGLAATAVLTTGAVIFCYAAFRNGWLLPLPMVGLAWPIAFTSAYTYQFLGEQRQRRWIQHAFGHYLSPALIEHLCEYPDQLKIGGECREVTVAFMDISGFTELAERLGEDPERLMRIINAYLEKAVACINARYGYVDKFLGDAVMAIWGAPVDDIEQAQHAVDAALASIRALEDVNRDYSQAQEGMPPLDVRVGINSGDAVVGNMGGDSRFNYTATGDAVNLAARLEPANKLYGTRLLIGERTARLLRGRYLIRRVDILRVKGKQRAVRVYEVVAEYITASEEQCNQVRRFNEALLAYYQGKFETAHAGFTAVTNEFNDSVAKMYAHRCHELITDPPGADWDPIHTLHEK